jgi:hypothetical protein
MSDYKVYDGHNWIDPCWHHIYYRDNAIDLSGKPANKWILLDPYNRDLYYHDGTYNGVPSNSPNFPTWKPIKCVCYCDEAAGYFYDLTLQRCTKRSYQNTICEGECQNEDLAQAPINIDLGQKGLIFWDTESFYTSMLIPGQGLSVNTANLESNITDYGNSPNNSLMYYAGYKGIKNKVWGGNPTFAFYNRLNSVGLWPQGRTMDTLFKTTLLCTTAKTFIIGMAGKHGCRLDYYDQIQQQATTMFEINQNNTGQCDYWHTFSIALPAGNHQLWFWGYAGGATDDMFGAEIYDISIESFKQKFGKADTGSLLTKEGVPGLNNYIIWSTKRFIATPPLQYPVYEPNETVSASFDCPAGYTFTSINGFPTCEKITVVECSDLIIEEPSCCCSPGYTPNIPLQKCFRSVAPEFDGQMTVVSPGCNLPGTYGGTGMRLYPTQSFAINTFFYQQPLDNNYQFRVVTGTPATTVGTNLNLLLNTWNTYITAWQTTSTVNFATPGNVWYNRLNTVGIARWAYKVWNKKKNYSNGTKVLVYDIITDSYIKYTATQSIPAATNAPYNIRPDLEPTKWSGPTALILPTVGNPNQIGDLENSDFNMEFTKCLTIGIQKVYHIGFSGDNNSRAYIQLDGTGPFHALFEANYTFNFNVWSIIPFVLPAGDHIIKMIGLNTGAAVSLGFEIYDMNIANDPTIDAETKFLEEFIYAPGTTIPSAPDHTTDDAAKLAPFIIFSTESMKGKAIPIQDGVNQLTCPDGSQVSFCDGSPVCVLKEPCADCNTVEAPQINRSTEINIWFDNSGSMSSSETALNEMRTSTLKLCLLQIYDNDPVLYDEKVKFFDMGGLTGEPYYERFIKCLGTLRNYGRNPDLEPGLVINLVFQDESTPYNAPGATGSPAVQAPPFNNNAIAPDYSADIVQTKNNLITASAQDYQIKGTLFQIKTTVLGFPFDDFRDLALATFGSTGVYTANSNLSLENSQGIFNLDTEVPAAQTAIFYKNKVVQALNALSINLTCP